MESNVLQEYLEGFFIRGLSICDRKELLQVVEPFMEPNIFFEDYSISQYITQEHLRGIADCYLHPDRDIRMIAVKLIQLNLQQVDLDCTQLIPCLFAMTADPDEAIQRAGKDMLETNSDIDPRAIISESPNAIRFAFQLHKVLSTDENIVRGNNIDPVTQSVASVNAYLYQYLLQLPQELELNVSAVHYFMRDLFKQMISLDANLAYKLYLCDNIAYFPYKTRGEVLCVVWYINICLTQNSKDQLVSLRKNLHLTEQEESLFYADFNATAFRLMVEKMPVDCKDIFIDVHVIYILLLILRTKDFLVEAYTIANSMDIHSPYVKEPDDALFLLCYDECEFNPVEAVTIIEQFPLVREPMVVDDEVRRDLIKEYVFLSLELAPYVSPADKI